MALSPYSGKYQTLTEDLDYKTESGEIDSREDILSFLEERGVSLEDFISATKRYDADVASGKATNLPGTVGSRILGSFISSGGNVIDEEYSYYYSFLIHQSFYLFYIYSYSIILSNSNRI